MEMKNINVLFIREDINLTKQIFKDLKGNIYYCRLEGSGWYTATNDFEVGYTVNDKFNICDAQGKVISSDVNYPFMIKFVENNCKDIINNNKNYDEWIEYLLKDKKSYGYTDFDDTWLIEESEEFNRKVEFTLDYLGKEVTIMRRNYKHSIWGKTWSSFTAEIEGDHFKILSYSF